MSFSYNSRPGTSLIDKVRFLIDDKNEETHLVENEEIESILDHFNITSIDENINAVCAEILEAVAVKYAKKQETSTSNVRTNLSSIYRKLKEQAEYFRMNSVTSSHFKAPSVSSARKQAIRDSSDNVDSFFRREMFRNPEAPNPPESSEDNEDAVT